MSGNPIPFATVEEALEEIRQGRQIVLVDDEDARNEGDSPWLRRRIHARSVTSWPGTAGPVCLALTGSAAHELALPLMTRVNTSNTARPSANRLTRGAHDHGISTSDRATTIPRRDR